MINKQDFNNMMTKIGIEASEAQYKLFDRYATMLREWNEKVNLTAITDPEGILIKHFADSLLPLTLVDVCADAKLIDVGTGAGFPSVPMKLIRSDLQLTLLDSLDKRLTFLRSLCGELGVAATMVHARAEDAGKLELYREQFDVATCRAVANMSELAEYCLPLLRVGGMLLAFKGSSSSEEVETAAVAIETCGGKLEQVLDYALPSGDPRTLVVVRKVSATPAKYPRNSGKISKKPL